jgi:hypothetical protein
LRVRAVAGEVVVLGMAPPCGSERRHLVASKVVSHHMIGFGCTRLDQGKRFIQIKSSPYIHELAARNQFRFGAPGAKGVDPVHAAVNLFHGFFFSKIIPKILENPRMP